MNHSAVLAGLGLIACSDLAQAQAERLEDVNALSWYTYSGDHAISDRWGLHIEGQLRRSNFITQTQQVLLRPAVNFELTSSIRATAGYAFVRTSPFGDFPDPTAYPEHRAYEEVTFSGERLSHRVRLEQRFLSEAPDAGWRYQNRFRYALQLRQPLRESVYLQMSAEPQVRFGVNYRGRAFDQQQTYFGLGFKRGDHLRVEFGYMYQFGVPRRGRVYEHNHGFQVNVASDAAFRR